MCLWLDLGVFGGLIKFPGFCRRLGFHQSLFQAERQLVEIAVRIAHEFWVGQLGPHEHGALHKTAELDAVPGILALLFKVLESLEQVPADKILPVAQTDVVQKFPLRAFFLLLGRRMDEHQIEKVKPERVLLALQFC